MAERAGKGPLAFQAELGRHGGINSGIVGANDPGHLRGYHRSRDRLLELGFGRGDYALTYDEDWEGPSDAVSAADVSHGNAATLRTWMTRVMVAVQKQDPRTRVLAEVYGPTPDGQAVTGWWEANPDTPADDEFASSDSSHEWHIHFGGWKKYADDVDAWLDLAAVMLDEPAEQEDDMPYTPEQFKAMVREVLNEVLNEGTAKGQPDWAATSRATLSTIQGVVNLVRGVSAQVAAVRGDVSTIDDVIVASIIEKLPPDGELSGTDAGEAIRAAVTQGVEAVFAKLAMPKPDGV